MPALARNTDPLTSHEAAARIVAIGTAADHRSLLLDAVGRMPGRTCAELARMVGLDRHQASKRLPELRAAGLVRNGADRKCSIAGTTQMTWWPTVVELRLTQKGFW